MRLSNALLLLAFTASVSALYVDRASGEHLEIRAATGSCVSGSYGLRRGDGYKGYCCKDQSDCWNQCIKGKCDGPSKPNTTKTTKTTKTTTTSKPASSSCISGSEGRRRGDGYNGYCCQDHSDCWDQCIKGKCNGPSKPSTTLKTTTKTTTKKTTKITTKTTSKTTKTSTSKTATATTSTKTPTTSSTTTTTATPTTTTTTTESPTTTTETSTSTSTTTTTESPTTTVSTTTASTTTTTTTTTVPSPTMSPLGCYGVGSFTAYSHTSNFIGANWCRDRCTTMFSSQDSVIEYIGLSYNRRPNLLSSYVCICYKTATFQPSTSVSTYNGCTSYSDDGMATFGLMDSETFGPPSSVYIYQL